MKNSVSLAPPALTLEGLLKLHDEAFVTGAYKVLLGRSPDPEGRENYLRQVRAGTQKSKIVAELAGSPEGRLRSAELPGLGDLIAEYGKGAPSFWSRVFRRLSSTPMETIERQLRVIDNRLYMMEQCAAEQNRQMAALLIVLTQGLSEPVGSSFHPNASNVGDVIDSTPRSILPLNVRQTFSDLKATIEMKRSE
jgi:Domain of unknown function (DUF4214)